MEHNHLPFYNGGHAPLPLLAAVGVADNCAPMQFVFVLGEDCLPTHQAQSQCFACPLTRLCLQCYPEVLPRKHMQPCLMLTASLSLLCVQWLWVDVACGAVPLYIVIIPRLSYLWVTKGETFCIHVQPPSVGSRCTTLIHINLQDRQFSVAADAVGSGSHH